MEFVDEAAWVENTTLAFHVDDDEENADHGSRRVPPPLALDLLFEESGFNLKPCPVFCRPPSLLASLFGDHAMVHEDGIRVEVPALNFSDYLARNFVPEDTVIVRCDIEGAEYEVLKSMIVMGTARLVDYMDVEWHAMLSPSLHHLKQVCACGVCVWCVRVVRVRRCSRRDSACCRPTLCYRGCCKASALK